MSQHHFFIGVDGGATKCVVRVEAEDGTLLGKSTSGPANIRLSVEQAWLSIYTALNQILFSLSLSLKDKNHQFHIGLGLSGCEIGSAYEAFAACKHSFATFALTSDSHVACLGAHGGKDGAIIVIGTGVVGFQIQNDNKTKIGGWGFPHDDEGGGAWLGLEAAKLTLQYLDGRAQESQLAKAIYHYFSNSRENLVHWANQANSTQFAELAPIVIEQLKAGEPTALNLFKRAAYLINQIDHALLIQQAGPSPLACALIGSIAPFLEPYLDTRLRTRLQPCQLTPDAGAILLVRHYMSKKQYA